VVRGLGLGRAAGLAASFDVELATAVAVEPAGSKTAIDPAVVGTAAGILLLLLSPSATVGRSLGLERVTAWAAAFHAEPATAVVARLVSLKAVVGPTTVLAAKATVLAGAT